MFGALARGRCLLQTAAKPRACYASYFTVAAKPKESLRILFCGSDEFSCESLKALHDEHKSDPKSISSIDVVVRPPKPTGRGYKVLRESPAQTLATQLGLPIHQRDTFTGWNMPEPNGKPINLIIAVSFGLFVPRRLLEVAEYGGLNVHPSLLPDLRGPAPIHHALLNSDTHTGVTIQTLSPTGFDAGRILLQTPSPGIEIPPNCTVPQLSSTLAPTGAKMLVEALRKGLHLLSPPEIDESIAEPERTILKVPADLDLLPLGAQHVPTKIRYAPKIQPSDRQVPWAGKAQAIFSTQDDSHSIARDIARDIALRARVLGPLWTHLRIGGGGRLVEKVVGGHGKEIPGSFKRAILEDVSVADAPPVTVKSEADERAIWRRRDLDGDAGRWVEAWRTGVMPESAGAVRLIWYPEQRGGGGVLMRMEDWTWIRVGRIKMEGSTSKPARQVLERIAMGKA